MAGSIKKKGFPSPNAYRLPTTLNKSRAFSMRKRLKTDMDASDKHHPGPGYYDLGAEMISGKGKYALSQHQ